MAACQNFLLLAVIHPDCHVQQVQTILDKLFSWDRFIIERWFGRLQFEMGLKCTNYCSTVTSFDHIPSYIVAYTLGQARTKMSNVACA